MAKWTVTFFRPLLHEQASKDSEETEIDSEETEIASTASSKANVLLYCDNGS